MSSSSLDPDLLDEISSIAESADCELLHVSFIRGTLRVILDRPDEDVTITHCTSVSRQLSALLDVHDFGVGRYTLEVTSPGLDRELYGPRDYERFVGRLARVTFESGSGKKTVVGRLSAYHPAADGDGDLDGGHVELTEEPSERSHRIHVDQIQQARLEVEL